MKGSASAGHRGDVAALLRRGRRIRTLGIDDAPFVRGQRGSVLVTGAVCAGTALEGLLSTKVRLDGFDATRKLLGMVSGSKFFGQLHAVLLDGVTLGGFNVVDLPALHAGLGMPILAVMRKEPDREAMRRIVLGMSQPARRQAVLDRAGPIWGGSPVYFQVHGLEPEVAVGLLAAVTLRGHVPEPLRLAHLIGGGIVNGESGHRA